MLNKHIIIFLGILFCNVLQMQNLHSMIFNRPYDKRTPAQWQRVIDSYSGIKEDVSSPLELRCSDGAIKVDRALTNKSETLKGFCSIGSDHQSVRSLDLTKMSHSCDKKTVKNLFDVMENKLSVDTLSTHELTNLVKFSDDLAISDSIASDIMFEYNLRDEFVQKSFIRGDTLDLSGLKLKNLDYLEKLMPQDVSFAKRNAVAKAITRLNISNNHLKKLDIAYITKILPHLRVIKADNNQIEEISAKDIASLPKKTDLFLTNNGLKKIVGSTLVAPEGCWINLDNNNLSDAQIESLWEKYRKGRSYVMIPSSNLMNKIFGDGGGFSIIRIADQVYMNKNAANKFAHSWAGMYPKGFIEIVPPQKK